MGLICLLTGNEAGSRHGVPCGMAATPTQGVDGVEQLRWFGPGVRRSLLEAGEGAAEDEVDAVGGAVALLGNQELGLGPLLREFIGLEGVGPMNEDDHVGVLFDGARLAPIAKLVAALFALGRARELGEDQDRNLQLLRKSFQ